MKKNGKNCNEIAEKVKKRIDDNYANTDIKIKDVAEKYDMDYKIIREQFKLQYGMTMKEYIDNKRYEHFKRLIQESVSDAPEIAQVYAREIGMNSSSNLNRLIKHKANMTFKEYVKKHFANKK